MLLYLSWTFAASALLAGGWCASAWLHQRRIGLLQVQLKLMRQTANAHTDQARRQIGQLQAELAARPAPVRPAPACAADEVLSEGFRRRPGVPDRFVVLEDGFAQTAIIATDGYAQTQLMR